MGGGVVVVVVDQARTGTRGSMDDGWRIDRRQDSIIRVSEAAQMNGGWNSG